MQRHVSVCKKLAQCLPPSEYSINVRHYRCDWLIIMIISPDSLLNMFTILKVVTTMNKCLNRSHFSLNYSQR